MQLVAADVDREDAARAAREQDLSEAAGRSADIEADTIADVDREPIERVRELDAAARDPGERGLGRDRRIDGDLLGGLAHGGAVRSEEHTSELQSRRDLVCRLLLEKKKKTRINRIYFKKKKKIKKKKK